MRSVLKNKPYEKMLYFINKSTAKAIKTNLLFSSTEELLFGAEWERKLYIFDLFMVCIDNLYSNIEGKSIINKAINHYPIIMDNWAKIKISNDLKKKTGLNIIINEEIINNIIKGYRDQAYFWLFELCYLEFEQYFNSIIKDIEDYKKFDMFLLTNYVKSFLENISYNSKVKYIKDTFEQIINLVIELTIGISESVERDLSNYQMNLDELYNLIKNDSEIFKLNSNSVNIFNAQLNFVKTYVENSRMYFIDDHIVWTKYVYEDFCKKLIENLKKGNIDTFGELIISRQENPDNDKALQIYKKLLNEYTPIPEKEEKNNSNNSNLKIFNYKILNS
ncbi:hypothetical protein [Streptococcus uberis]